MSRSLILQPPLHTQTLQLGRQSEDRWELKGPSWKSKAILDTHASSGSCKKKYLVVLRLLWKGRSWFLIWWAVKRQRSSKIPTAQKNSTRVLIEKSDKVPRSQILQDKRHHSVMFLNTFVGNDGQVQSGKATHWAGFFQSASQFQPRSPLVNVWLVPFQSAQINYTGSKARWFPLLCAVHFQQHCRDPVWDVLSQPPRWCLHQPVSHWLDVGPAWKDTDEKTIIRICLQWLQKYSHYFITNETLQSCIIRETNSYVTSSLRFDNCR